MDRRYTLILIIFLFSSVVILVDGQVSRNPRRSLASVNPGRLDHKLLDWDAVPRAVTVRVVEEASIQDSANGPILTLGHFRSQLPNGTAVELCELFPKITVSFEGVGVGGLSPDASDGGPIKMDVTFPCRGPSERNQYAIKSVELPLSQLTQKRPTHSELTVQDGQAQILLRVNGEAPQWPERFVIHSITLQSERADLSDLKLDRSTIARHTRKPLDFKVFGPALSALSPPQEANTY